MLHKKKRPWTDEEDRRLLEMIGNQRPKTSIAAALKRTVSAVTGRLRVLRALQRSSIDEQAGGSAP